MILRKFNFYYYDVDENRQESILFGQTFPPSIPAFLFHCVSQKELHSSRAAKFDLN